MLNDRRGDVCLLINGMPVIHIELKKSGIPVSQATNQIAKYAHEGVFTGLFRLVQVFVAMNPDDAVYFANPGEGDFNSNYFFHWADFNNEPIAANKHVGQDEWKRFASDLLSIPMAHQLIGFYTVADSADGCLKVLRSYQYQAVNAISDRVRTCKWDEPVPSGTPGRPGGYVWHTTGSGKTMTSFKAAQLIAGSKDADKVVFLMDRVELGTQSLLEYRSFADDADDVQGTENTDVLKSKLASIDPKDTLIVTSIQKMSNIKAGEGHITEEEVRSSLANASYSSLTNAIVPRSARCCRIFAIPSRTRCISVSRALRFMRRTVRRARPHQWCSAIAFTDTASPTASAMAMCSDSTVHGVDLPR